jgi:hypothetical protein
MSMPQPKNGDPSGQRDWDERWDEARRVILRPTASDYGSGMATAFAPDAQNWPP